MNELKARFDQLPQRQQWLVVIAAILVVVYIAVGLIYRPLAVKRDLLIQRNDGAERTLQWIRGAITEIKALRGSGNASAVAGSGMTLSQLVESSAARHGLRVTRFQPSGDDEAQVWLDKVSFDSTVMMIDQLENHYGLHVMSVAVSGANAPGLVNVRLRFRKGA
jgi:type II secretory pathway component PulM